MYDIEEMFIRRIRLGLPSIEFQIIEEHSRNPSDCVGSVADIR